MAPDLLRIPIAQAARRLGCSVKTLKRRGVAGRPEIVKDGSRLYVPEASLRAYAGEEQASAEQAAGWQGLADLRLLFPIPELEARRPRGPRGSPVPDRAERGEGAMNEITSPTEEELAEVEAKLRRRPPGTQLKVGGEVYMRLDGEGRRRFDYRGLNGIAGGTRDSWQEAYEAREKVKEEAQKALDAKALLGALRLPAELDKLPGPVARMNRDELRKLPLVYCAAGAYWPEPPPPTTTSSRLAVPSASTHSASRSSSSTRSPASRACTVRTAAATETAAPTLRSRRARTSRR